MPIQSFTFIRNYHDTALIMHILIVNRSKIPVSAYGGAERIIWWLGKALVQMGHKVTYLVQKKSTCPFANVLWLDEKRPLAAQIPEECDLIHLHFQSEEELPKPTLFTYHENSEKAQQFHPNTVFLSRNHAQRHGGTEFVYNGLDLNDYGTPVLDNKRMYLHFLGKADWRVKNVKGAIELAKRTGDRLHVIGGSRVNFRRGLRITLNSHVRFHGMLGGDGKNVLLNGSKGLLYPTLWHEPFGLAMLESWWFGCPVFGTPYGSLPELVGDIRKNGHQRNNGNGVVDGIFSELGCISLKKSEIIEGIRDAGSYSRQRCHEYVADQFTSDRMAREYVALYEKVLGGYQVHTLPPICLEPQQGKLLPWQE